MLKISRLFPALGTLLFYVLSAGSTVLLVLLLGYWIGWKSVPIPARTIDTTLQKSEDSDSQNNQAGIASPLTSLDQSKSSLKAAQRKAAGLVTTLATSRLDRKASAQVVAEIAFMDLATVQTMLAELETSPPLDAVRQVQLYLVQRWASIDPKGAFDYVRATFPNSTDVPGFGSLERAVLFRWAAVDPAGAVQTWQSTGPSNDDDLFTLRTLFAIWSQQNVEQAFHAVHGLNGEQKTEALRGVAQLAHRSEGRDTLLAQLASLPDEGIREPALAEALRTWGRSSQFSQPAGWLDQSNISGKTKSKLEEEIAHGWFMQNRAEAANWLLSRAESEQARGQRMEQIVTRWAHNDPKACGEWLIQQGLSAEASGAMRLYAGTLAKEFPAEAVAWVRSIPNERVRQTAFAQVEREVKQRYPQQAEQLLR